MNRYEVNLYDKDNDHYTLVLETDNKELAITTCVSIGLLLKCQGIIVKRNDTEFGICKNEPFDWVEVYDNITKTVVMQKGV